MDKTDSQVEEHSFVFTVASVQTTNPVAETVLAMLVCVFVNVAGAHGVPATSKLAQD